MSDSFTAVEVTTIAIASVAVVLALWSLGWHLRSRRRSKSRLKVSEGHGVILGPGGGELVIIVRAQNTGSLPVAVMGWGFRLKRRKVHIPSEPLPASTAVPIVLRPGEDANFFVPMRDFERTVREMGSASARPFVTVAAGTAIRARRRARPIEPVTIKSGEENPAGPNRGFALGPSRSSIDS